MKKIDWKKVEKIAEANPLNPDYEPTPKPVIEPLTEREKQHASIVNYELIFAIVAIVIIIALKIFL